MKKLDKIIIFIFLAILVFNLNTPISSAASSNPGLNPSTLNLKDAFKVRDKLKCSENNILDCVADKAGFNVNKITAGGSNDTIEPLIQNAINIVLSLLGIIFVAFIIYGGWAWFSARGNEQKLDKAKDTLTQAIIGLLIVLGSYAISYFVLNVFIPYLK
ncbi:MAG: pilin [Candidatus Falkowbacteria bacterium]|nr:pilin [Candidatus Falkowbacteria bacterium]